MGSRTTISDYINSLLQAEIVNRCPLCGEFEKTNKPFNNHHINHDPSISEYWNLIKICTTCHNNINDAKDDGKRDRKIRQVKKDLFRHLIGTASYEVLLLANQNKITSSMPCLGAPLIKMELLAVTQENAFTAGKASHPTISDYKITEKGKELIKQLCLS